MFLQPKAREVRDSHAFSPTSESRRRAEFRPAWREEVLGKGNGGTQMTQILEHLANHICKNCFEDCSECRHFKLMSLLDRSEKVPRSKMASRVCDLLWLVLPIGIFSKLQSLLKPLCKVCGRC